MTQQRFETPGPVELVAQNKAGAVRLRTHTGTTTDVEVSATGTAGEELAQQTRVEHQDLGGRHRVTVDVPSPSGLLRSLLRGGTSVTVTVGLPEGASIEAETVSGEVTADGCFGAVKVHTVTGLISVSSAERDLAAKSTSGNVVIGSVSGQTKVETVSGSVQCDTLGGAGRLKTASGDVAVTRAGHELVIQTASGRVTAGQLASGCRLQTVSGDQRVDCVIAGQARLTTVSGDLTIGVARGTVVMVDAETVSGTLSSEIELEADGPPMVGADSPDSAHLELTARTVSGDLRIERAQS